MDDRIETVESWTSRRMSPYYNDYVAHQGFLYGFDSNIFACVDLEDGKRKWKKGRYGNGQVLLLPDGDQLLVISEDGELVLLRASSEKLMELAKYRVLDGRTWNHPVMVGGRLYVRNGRSGLFRDAARLAASCQLAGLNCRLSLREGRLSLRRS